MSKSVAFFFPYIGVSGVPVLFANIATFLSNQDIYKIHIIDYDDGYMTTRLNANEKVECIKFENGKDVFVDADILVMQSILPYGMRPEIQISQKTKLFFWNLHPMNLIPNVYPIVIIRDDLPNIYKILVSIFWRRKFNLMKDFISKAMNLNGISFMDSSNLESTIKFYSIKKANCTFLPITTSNYIKGNDTCNKNLTEIDISWVGRICDFKIHILNYLILRLSEAANKLETKINLHIIGDGPLIDKISFKNYLSSYFGVTILGSLNKVDLDNYLRSNVNINAAMGTSALESAKFGIPTILLDFDYKKINKLYKFRWLYDTKDYNLGHLISSSESISEGYELFDMLVDLINNQKIISEKTYDYYTSNHSLKAVTKQLIRQIENTRFTISDINPALLKKGLVRRVYEKIKYGK